MDTTTLVVTGLEEQETANRIRQVLDGEAGVGRVLVRPDRGEVYIRHSRARAPRQRLLDRLEAEGMHAQVKGR